MFPHLPNQIVYVRHPQCLHNVAYDRAIALGISTKDSPLTEVGELQARLTGEYLLREYGTFDLVIASDFIRTHTIPEAAGFEFLIDARVGERWHGELSEEGSAFFKRQPEAKIIFDTDYYHFKAPGGEDCSDVERRAIDFLSAEELFSGTSSILISSHGMFGLCFQKVLLQAGLDDWHRWHQTKRFANASVTEFVRSRDTYSIRLFNHKPWAGQVPDGISSEA